jgi:hypothetical protein
MYGSDSYSDWHHSLQMTISAAAVTELAAGPAVGEVWRVIAASAYHDDPAAHDMAWNLRQGATTLPMENGTNEPTMYKHQLYEKVFCKDPIVLRYGDYIVVQSSVVTAAGKKMYINADVQVLVGVTA